MRVNFCAQAILFKPRIGRSPSPRLRGALFIFSMAALLGLVSFTQAQPQADDAVSTRTSRKFSIGFLREGSDLENAPVVMENLLQYLRGRSDIQGALKSAGYSEMILSPCDNPRDMAQRMGEEEFEVVFANAFVYAGYTPRNYELILQTRRRGDISTPSHDGVLRRGVVFIGPHCPLFTKQQKLTREDIRSLLLHSPLAVPSADSAVSYVVPRFELLTDYGLPKPNFLFCGSDDEVVKNVVSGLVDVGACSKETLDTLCPQKDIDIFYRRLFLTDPAPTDPILIARDIIPIRSDVGRLIKTALRDFFGQDHGGRDRDGMTPELSVQPASDRVYEKLRKYLHDSEEPRTPRTSGPLPLQPTISQFHPTPIAQNVATTFTAKPTRGVVTVMPARKNDQPPAKAHKSNESYRTHKDQSDQPPPSNQTDSGQTDSRQEERPAMPPLAATPLPSSSRSAPPARPELESPKPMPAVPPALSIKAPPMPKYNMSRLPKPSPDAEAPGQEKAL